MESVDATSTGSVSQLVSPWGTEIRRRWARLHQLIAEMEYDLSQARVPQERTDLEDSLRLLKRTALSVWVDAHRVGLDLPEWHGTSIADRNGGEE